MKQSPLAAHVWPFGLFLGFLALTQLVASIGSGSPNPWLEDPKYWIFPLQTFACGAVLLYYWKFYEFGGPRWILATGVGVLALVLWIAPQALLGFDARTEGFDPTVFEQDSGLYWMAVVMRMARLVIVVPLVEEIFWRGFLMRYLVNEDFTKVAFGTFTPLSLFGVAGAFMLVHAIPDWPAAFVTGLLFGWVAIATKSLFACVLAHAVTNLLLGIYILKTGQWGFW